MGVGLGIEESLADFLSTGVLCRRGARITNDVDLYRFS